MAMTAKHVPTIEDVEKSTGWTSAANSGYRPNRVMDWRRDGRLRKGKDWFERDARFGNSPISNPVHFYRPEALQREATKDAETTQAEKMREHWADSERLEETIDGKT